MPLLATAIALAIQVQLPQESDPVKVTSLKPGELVRMYEYGGLTRRGVYRSLLVITEGGKVFLKNQNGSYSSRLEPGEATELRDNIKAFNMKSVTANPRTDGVSPSAYDGQDVYLSLRHGPKAVQWSNVKFVPPSEFPLREILKSIQSRTRGD